LIALETLRRISNLLRDAAGEIDVLQRGTIEDKSSMIQLQQEVIDEKQKEMKEVPSAIQAEIKSCQDAVSHKF
jgi:hypothetical protein